MSFESSTRRDVPVVLPRSPADMTSCLDALEVGLEIWDDQDKLIWYNKRDNHLRPAYFVPDDLGKSFRELQIMAQSRRASPEGESDQVNSVERMRAPRRTHKEPDLQELPGDRWVKNFETLSPDGYLMVVRVNVTELVRQGRLLEAKNRQLNLLSITDSMTGLANRRRFDEMLTAEWQRASRNGTDLSLLMVDIDHFKKYNDYYGHLAGDVCLRRVGNILRQCTRRAGDLAARYGGEEFVMLLPAADMERALEVAQRCMQRMEHEGIAHVGSPTAPLLTLSIGVACLDGHIVRDASSLVNAADTALYRAKSSGRARFEIATLADWDIDQDTPRTVPAPLN